MLKELDVTYNRQALLELSKTLNFGSAYSELGREIPQEIVFDFGITHPLIRQITSQLPNVQFYTSSFIRTKPNTKVQPHVDSSAVHKRTVNFLFPLANYNSPLIIEDKEFIINGPVAFRCDLPHSYENNTDEYRVAFILQCRRPYTFDRLIETKAI